MMTTKLPARASDPRETELESAISARHAARLDLIRELSRLDRDIAAAETTLRANALTIKSRDRSAAKAALAEQRDRREGIIDRLTEINDELEAAEPARATLRAEIDGAIAGKLRAEAERRAKAIDGALTTLLAELSAGRELAEHADAQLSDQATGVFRGGRVGLSTSALAVLAAFGESLDADSVNHWQREARAEGLI